jgi:hypothetical protein
MARRTAKKQEAAAQTPMDQYHTKQGLKTHDGHREREIYICASRLGLIKMGHCHTENGRNSQQ